MAEKLKKIRFKYFDKYCRDGKWSEQWCVVRSVEECVKLYGLGQDCLYEILSVEDAE